MSDRTKRAPQHVPIAEEDEEEASSLDFVVLVAHAHQNWCSLREALQPTVLLCSAVQDLCASLPRYLDFDKADDALVKDLQTLHAALQEMRVSLTVVTAANMEISRAFYDLHRFMQMSYDMNQIASVRGFGTA